MKFLRLMALSMLAAASVRAGEIHGALLGRVTSEGKPLPRATVTLESGALQVGHSTTTGPRGTYWLGALPPGTYRVTFSHEGTQTLIRNAEVHVAQSTRLDAELAPSAEGESVTSSRTARTVLEDIQTERVLASSTIEELPVGREVGSRIELAAGVIDGAIRGSARNLFATDGVWQQRRRGNTEIEDAIEETVVIAGTTAVEYGRFDGGIVVTVTKSGGNDLGGSFRATAIRRTGTDYIDSRYEATVGGRIIRDALWFFLAGESGSEQASSLKLTASPTPRQALVASSLYSANPDERRVAADYTLLARSNAIVEGHGDSTKDDDRRLSARYDHFTTTNRGDHLLIVGADRLRDSDAFYIHDRWSRARWLLSGGVRREGAATRARGGLAYDLAGDGGRRLALSLGRYESQHELSGSYAQRIAGNGAVRVSLVKRANCRSLELSATTQYLLFNLGGSATIARRERKFVAWIVAVPPALEHHVAVSLLERYTSGATATDVALQYRFTRYAATPFVKIDLTNLFNARDVTARSLRLAIGARIY